MAKNSVGAWQTAEVKVQQNGQILVFGTKSPRLDGVSFRTD